MEEWKLYLHIQAEAPHASETPIEDAVMCDCMEEEPQLMHD